MATRLCLRVKGRVRVKMRVRVGIRVRVRRLPNQVVRDRASSISGFKPPPDGCFFFVTRPDQTTSDETKKTKKKTDAKKNKTKTKAQHKT